MTDKRPLRRAMKELRLNMDPDTKIRADKAICREFCSSAYYESCEMLLLYVSGDIEVGTGEILDTALADGKNVLCPRCISGTNEMRFYRIESTDDLEPGHYGILEPKAYCPEVNAGCGSVCIVPALCFDRRGHRLGFGKGFYDRFLSGYEGISVGLCYDICIAENVCEEEHDVPVDAVITESGMILTNKNREDWSANG
ncbi:MAG: 5-formyltetrahydrofolate cyclo-ligase [Ruminococcus sp.]|nr:5-formyltetrahydrofolate cyclo-ligase [Ruminococcus sp.]